MARGCCQRGVESAPHRRGRRDFLEDTAAGGPAVCPQRETACGSLWRRCTRWSHPAHGTARGNQGGRWWDDQAVGTAACPVCGCVPSQTARTHQDPCLPACAGHASGTVALTGECVVHVPSTHV